MKRYIAYVAFILVLAPIESTLPRLPWLHNVRPLLLVPLVLFYALRLNTIEGVFLAALAGIVEEATISYPPGLATFTLVALFVGGRLALATIRGDGPIFEAFFALLLAGVYHAVVFGLRRVFESSNSLGSGWWRMHLWSCVATAVVTPFITSVARRIEKLQPKKQGLL